MPAIRRPPAECSRWSGVMSSAFVRTAVAATIRSGMFGTISLGIVLTAWATAASRGTTTRLRDEFFGASASLSQRCQGQPIALNQINDFHPRRLPRRKHHHPHAALRFERQVLQSANVHLSRRGAKSRPGYLELPPSASVPREAPPPLMPRFRDVPITDLDNEIRRKTRRLCRGLFPDQCCRLATNARTSCCFRGGSSRSISSTCSSTVMPVSR